MLKISAELRSEKGTCFSRRLRILNKLPGILYGKYKKPSIAIILDHNNIFNLQKKDDFYKENLLLLINNKEYLVKVQALQRHSFKLKLLHIDFLCV